MSYKHIVIAILLLVPCSVHAWEIDEWTTQDTILQVTCSALKTVDWLQTREIAVNPRYYETNPILGKYPSRSKVDIYFASTILAHGLVSYLLPHPYRTWWQCCWIGISATNVCHNYRIGIRIGF